MIFLNHLPFYDPQLATIDARFLYFFYSPLTFFFILSGWVLTHTYYEKILHKAFDIKKYYQKRLLRLYPIHFITFLLSIPFVVALHRAASLNITIANILLVHAFIPSADFLFSYNGMSWCLSIFLFLYLLFPLLISVTAHFDKFIRKYPLLIALVVIAGLGLYIHVTNYFDPLWYAYNFSPFERIVDFTVGICIYFIVKNIKVGKFFMTLTEIGAISLIIAAHWYAYLVPFWTMHKYMRDLYFIIPWGVIVGVFSFSDGIFSKILSWKPLVALGSISLEFFLIHNLSIQWVYLFIAQKIPMDSIQKMFAAFFITLVGSFIVHFMLSYIVPALRLFNVKTEKIRTSIS